MPAAVARRTRYEGPRFAERFPDTPQGMEALASHQEARRLPRDTDPDTIGDEGTRRAFLAQLDEERREDDADTGGATRRGRGDTSTRSEAPAASGVLGRVGSTGFAVGDSISSAVFGMLGYALLVNYVRGGTPQVRRWISAKFTNGQGRLP